MWATATTRTTCTRRPGVRCTATSNTSRRPPAELRPSGGRILAPRRGPAAPPAGKRISWSWASFKVAAMRLTLIFPSVGRKPGVPYVRAWQMEPLSMALLAGLTPPSVEVRFYDDRIEDIPFDEPTDLVALSVETFTALRAYKIARRFRARGVPVVMGGYHVTLLPEEARRE